MLLTIIVFIPLLVFAQIAETGDALNTAYQALKAAEESKDADAIKKYAVESSRLAREITASKAPAGAAAAANHKSRVEFAKQVETYADYALYVGILRTDDTAKRMDMFETLEKQSPKSEYLPKLNSLYMGLLGQSGQQAKIFPFAERAIARDPQNEDLLTVLAEGALARKQWDRAATFATRLTSHLGAHAAPEGVPTGDWERRRTAMLTNGYYIAGIAYATVSKFPQADRNLRAALPLVKDNEQMTAAALFHLGVANYNLARVTNNKPQMKEAVAFSEQCAKIRSGFQDQAVKNAWGMKQELSRMR